MTRDSLKDETWLNEWTRFLEAAISESIDTAMRPAGNPGYRPQYIRDLAFMYAKLVLRRYSRGDPITELAQYFEPLLHYWEESERLGKDVWTPEQQSIRHIWSINLDFYIDCFWLVGLALALEIPEAQWRRLIALVGNDGEDALLDRIIATRSPDRRIGNSLCYPKPYAQLMMVIDTPRPTQPALLAKFVQHWYKDIRAAAKSGREKQAIPHREPYWYSYHRMEGGYFGYWCLEALAAVKAFGLDDSQCLGHPHYPGDLLRPGVVTPSDMSRLPSELVEAIGAPPQPPFTGEPKEISSWEAFKLVLKNKLGH